MLNCSECYSVTFQSRHDGSLRDSPSWCFRPSHWLTAKTGKGGASVAPIHDRSKWLRKSSEVYLSRAEIHNALTKQTPCPCSLPNLWNEDSVSQPNLCKLFFLLEHIVCVNIIKFIPCELICSHQTKALAPPTTLLLEKNNNNDTNVINDWVCNVNAIKYSLPLIKITEENDKLVLKLWWSKPKQQFTTLNAHPTRCHVG